jgi:hypothetical protein
MWNEVGKILEQTRIQRKLRPMDVERAGGPSYKTVQAIDNGQIGNVESLDKYARALKLSIVDILHDVLAAKTTALSPEAAQVVRKFVQTTVEGRTAMLSVANALPLAAATSGVPSTTTDAAAPSKGRPPRSVPRASRRRTVQ